MRKNMGPPNIRIKFKHFEATLDYYEVIYFNISPDLKLFMSTLNSHSFYFKNLKTQAKSRYIYFTIRQLLLYLNFLIRPV